VHILSPPLTAEPEDLTKPGDGYRTLFFTIPGEEQVFQFVGEHQAILAAYYSIIRFCNYRLSLRTAVFDGASDLLDDRLEHSAWAKFMYWRRCARRIDSVFQAFLRQKMNQVATERFMSEINDDENISRTSVFYRSIEREAQDNERIPDEDIRELLIMIEERRRGYFQNVATLASGLAGGLIGAIFGASLTFALSSSPTRAPFATVGVDTKLPNNQNGIETHTSK
jgi:hypothetical protein